MTTQVNNRTSRQYDNQVQENQQTGRSTASPNAAGSQSQWRPIDPPRNAHTPVMRDTSNPSSMERGDSQQNQSEPSTSGTAPQQRSEVGGTNARNAGDAMQSPSNGSPSRGTSPAIYSGDGSGNGSAQPSTRGVALARSVAGSASSSEALARAERSVDQRGMSAQPAAMRMPSAPEETKHAQFYAKAPYTSKRDNNNNLTYTLAGKVATSYTSTPEDKQGFSFKGFNEDELKMVKRDVGHDTYAADKAWDEIQRGRDENYTKAFGSTDQNDFDQSQRTIRNIDYGLRHEHFNVERYKGDDKANVSSFTGSDHTIYLGDKYFKPNSDPSKHDGQILRAASNMSDIGDTDNIIDDRKIAEQMPYVRPDLAVHNTENYWIYANLAATSAEQKTPPAQPVKLDDASKTTTGRFSPEAYLRKDGVVTRDRDGFHDLGTGPIRRHATSTPVDERGTFTPVGFTDDQVTTLTNDFNRDKQFADEAYQRVQQPPDSLYRTYFGAENQENLDTVRRNVNNIDYALNNEHFTIKAASEYVKAHPDYEVREGTVAFIPDDEISKHTIYIAPEYFNPTTSKNDHYGSLIHEVSHMSDVAHTSDIEYLDRPSAHLARDHPERAITNADNYRLYMIGGQKTDWGNV